MRLHATFSIVIVVALLVHVGVVGWAHIRGGGIDARAFQSLDCAEYYAIARTLINHGVFSQDNEPPHVADTWRTPGYPVFLAGAIVLFGDSPTALVVLQHAIAAASAVIFFLLLRNFVSPGKAFLGSLFFLLEPYHLLYASWLLSTTLFTFVLLLMWRFWERARSGAALWHYVITGLLSGLLVLIWPGAILIPVFMASAMFLSRLVSTPWPDHHISTSRLRWSVLLIVILGGAAPPLAWMARNKLVAGHFALSHQSGIVLAYFKATEFELWRQGRTKDRYLETSLNPSSRDLPHAVWEAIDVKLCERMTFAISSANQPNGCSSLRWPNLAQGNKTAFDSFEVSRQLAAIGKEMLLESPISSAFCGVVRVFENLTFPLNLAINPAAGTPNSRQRNLLFGLAYLALLAAAIAGTWRARGRFADLLFPVAIIIALSLTTSPQVDPRFRVPMIPLLIFLALVPSRRAES